MTKEFEDKTLNEKDLKDLNNRCEECKKEDESVSQNLILTGFKIANLVELQKLSFLSNYKNLLAKLPSYSLRMKQKLLQLLKKIKKLHLEI